MQTEIELVYADGEDFHKLAMLMIGDDLRMFIDGEEKQIVGRVWVGGQEEDPLSHREPEKREDTEVSGEDQERGSTYGGL